MGEVLSQDRLAQLAALEERLGVRFRDRSLLDLALRHGSFSHEQGRDPAKSYERLEFLGDAVLSLVVSDDLYRRYPEADEGGLAKQRARIVNEAALASIARRLGLAHYILLGRGEEKAGGRQRPSLLADTVESVIGAVYIDSGYGVAHHLVTRWLGELGDVLQQEGEDFKSQLQELLQQRRQMPRYRITQEEGPDHARTFVATVEAGGRTLGGGRGKSKKEAEQAAAAQALQHLARADRPERPERPERLERPQLHDRVERGGRSERRDRAERPGRQERRAHGRPPRPEAPRGTGPRPEPSHAEPAARSDHAGPSPRQDEGHRPPRQDRQPRGDSGGPSRPDRPPRGDSGGPPRADRHDPLGPDRSGPGP